VISVIFKHSKTGRALGVGVGVLILPGGTVLYRTGITIDQLQNSLMRLEGTLAACACILVPVPELCLSELSRDGPPSILDPATRQN